MPDGSVVKGAQGDFPVDRFIARQAEFVLAQPELGANAFRTMREQDWILSGVPWITPRAEADRLPDAQWIRQKAAVPPGVHERQGTTNAHPPHTPSLIGIRNHRYLDATGLIRHRTIDDLMRYAALNYGLDIVAHFGDFQPSPTMLGAQDGTRYSDEQLYVLAKYLYSLEPPANPNPVTAETRRRAHDLRAAAVRRVSHPAALHQQYADARARFRRARRSADGRRDHERLRGDRSLADDEEPARDRVLQGAFIAWRVVSERIRSQRAGGHVGGMVQHRGIGCVRITCPRGSVSHPDPSPGTNMDCGFLSRTSGR